MLRAMMLDSAPRAVPVTGPTIKVAVPAPIVVIEIGSDTPKPTATIAPTKKERTTPIRTEREPIQPAFFNASSSAPYAVATIAKSLNMAPPRIPSPEKTLISAKPLLPPVVEPPR